MLQNDRDDREREGDTCYRMIEMIEREGYEL